MLAADDGDAVDAAEVVAGGAAGFSADVVDVAVLAAAAGFSVAAGVAGGTAAICVPVALLLAAGLAARTRAPRPPASRRDRIRGQEARRAGILRRFRRR